MIHPNELPDAPEWQIEPRECPIPCGICETRQQSIYMHGTDAHLVLGEN